MAKRNRPAKKTKNARKRPARRPASANRTDISYEPIRNEILAVRKALELTVKPTPTPQRERLVTAIRNLDIALVVLECNQSLSATDYHTVPWKHMPRRERLAPSRKSNGRLA